MSGSGHYPPPGWQPPPAPRPPAPGLSTPPGLPPPPGPPALPGPPYRPPYAPQVGPLPWGPVHRPGAVPLRPLGLGDLYDGSFRIIRANPRATVGATLLVSALAALVPLLVTAVVSVLVDLSIDITATDGSSVTSGTGWLVAVGSFALGSALQGVGLVLVTGMVAHVCHAAAVGRRLSLGEAWAATRGARWRLLGLAVLLIAVSGLVLGLYLVATIAVVTLAPGVLIALYFVVTVPAMISLSLWSWVRVAYLAVPALMLERRGVFASLARSVRLTRRQFWRTLGIALLTALMTQVVSSVVGIPLSMASQVLPLFLADSRYLGLVVMVLLSLSNVLAAALVTPFTAAVASLQYLDQRMRKEAYDVELLAQAGTTAS